MTPLGTLMLISILMLIMPNIMKALLEVIGTISLLVFVAMGILYLINSIF